MTAFVQYHKFSFFKTVLQPVLTSQISSPVNIPQGLFGYRNLRKPIMGDRGTCFGDEKYTMCPVGFENRNLMCRNKVL